MACARGAFLGVDAFFVLSGFLVTGLLLAEWERTGRIALGAFWCRRARRLLPALLLVLCAVTASASAVLLMMLNRPEDLGRSTTAPTTGAPAC